MIIFSHKKLVALFKNRGQTFDSQTKYNRKEDDFELTIKDFLVELFLNFY
jgi:hypothetical protein